MKRVYSSIDGIADAMIADSHRDEEANYIDNATIETLRDALTASEAKIARLRSFAESFHFTVTDSFYKDAYIGIHEPDSVTFRLGNGSQFSKNLAKLEERRKAALTDGSPS